MIEFLLKIGASMFIAFAIVMLFIVTFGYLALLFEIWRGQP